MNNPLSNSSGSRLLPTATGPVSTASLGFTLMHEHVFQHTEDVFHEFPHLWDADRRSEQAATALSAATAGGVKTLVDMTVVGHGRDVPLVMEVARRTGLQIVVATGLYALERLPRNFNDRSIDQMADLFVYDIEVGVQGTGVTAGVIKAAIDRQGVTEGVDKAVRAAARAHRRTGVPLSTHTHAATKRGLDQQRIFREEGVDLSRVIIGHSGDTEDIDYLDEVIDAGSYVGMDRFGLAEILPDRARVATVAALCDRGYADRMVLSQDASVANDDFAGRFEDDAWQGGQFGHLANIVLPALREAGVSAADIETMTVVNPRRIFEAQGAS